MNITVKVCPNWYTINQTWPSIDKMVAKVCRGWAFLTATTTVLLQSNLADVHVIQIGDNASIGGDTTKQGH